MKIIIKLLLVGLVVISTTISLFAQNTNGLIVVESDGKGKNKQMAIEDAQYKAFEIIMFKGIPGTDLNLPLIANETEAKSKFKKYFEALKQSRFKGFITNTNVTSEFVKNAKGAKNISIQTEINYKALRSDLEQNQITRKFGF
jgi:hypothetical protein